MVVCVWMFVVWVLGSLIEFLLVSNIWVIDSVINDEFVLDINI